MTTIAYNHKERKIAVDSRQTAGNFIYSDKALKIESNEHGSWFIAGSVVDIDSIIAGIGKPKRGRFSKLENAGSFDGIVCDSDGNVFEFYHGEDNLMVLDMTESGACGSGRDYATAAMDFGKSCKEAVEYAMTRDSATGGKVLVFDCETKKVLKLDEIVKG